MIILETLLIVVLMSLLLYTIISDGKRGEIKNKTLLLHLAVIFPLNCLYYFFYTQYLGVFLKNIAVVIIISMILYFCDNWAAGDAKLMMTAFFAIPSRFYDIGINYFGFWCIGVSFLVAFVYVLIDTVIRIIKNRKKYNRNNFSLLRYAKNIIFIYCIFRSISVFVWVDLRLMIIINFVVLLLIIKFAGKINWKVVAVSVAIYTAVCIYQKSFGSVSINMYSLLFALGFPILSSVCSLFNYEEIRTQNVSKGMILSNLTVADMMKSKVTGLPNGLSEDLRSRITEEEAENVKRWESSKYGKETVTIVRKIPFAIFISIGCVIFIAICVLLLLMGWGGEYVY